MLQAGYILSDYWPGDYWHSAYFPTLGASNVSWYKVALEGHDVAFTGLTLTGMSGFVLAEAGVISAEAILDLGASA
jgi:hypothetical protein